MSKTRALLLVPFVLTVTARAEVRAGTGKPDPAAARAKVATSNNEFGADLYGKLRAEKGNLFFSPYSVLNALAMVYAGARGDTATRLEKVLHFDAGGGVHGGLATLTKEMSGGNKPAYDLSIANAIWGRKGLKVVAEWSKLISESYGAELRTVDFGSEAEKARATINKWVAEKTHDKIPELLQRGTVTKQTRMVLTNAVYFRGTWENPFPKELTQNAAFHGSKGKQSVPMMSQTAGFSYLENKTFSAVELPYKGDRLSMVVFLPAKKDGLAAFEKQFSAKNLETWVKELKPSFLSVSLPRFKVSSTFSLGDVLQKLGMGKALGKEADLSGMIDKSEKVWLDNVVHQAVVEVDEVGTVAAAATAVGVAGGGPPPEFRADHPFFFVIRDRVSGTVLFAGRVETVE